MQSLRIRLISAFFGLLILFLVGGFLGTKGMLPLICVIVVLALREGTRMLFPDEPAVLRWLFALLAVTLFTVGMLAYDSLALVSAVIFVLIFPIALMAGHARDLEGLMRVQSRAVLGLFYLAILPMFACQVFSLNHGLPWFFALMSFVFSGDSMAYIFGLSFGKTPLLPAVSPKKTQEGSFGGLLGSALAGVVMHSFLPHVPVLYLVLLAVLSGALGQIGDLFESLLKRVANQKDSGTLMPGHGGILDRIDGILFAAPLFFVGASLLEKWF